jgi:hypothetical protein
MAFLRLTQAVLRFINGACERWLPPEKISERHRIVRKREQDAYFYLRRQGYTMVAQNFRSPLRHGEIDLSGWEGRVLCFVEVKREPPREPRPSPRWIKKEAGRNRRSALLPSLLATLVPVAFRFSECFSKEFPGALRA